MELKISNLSKTYKNGKKALIGFSADFSNGIYGILGPNGAGKSTLTNIIVGNITSNDGGVTFDGEDILRMGKEFRSIIGYMPQQQGSI